MTELDYWKMSLPSALKVDASLENDQTSSAAVLELQ